jgi:DNA-binding transcriptional ArsR family regulator
MLTNQERRRFKKIIGKMDKNVPKVFDSLRDPTRCRIFHLFVQNKELCVTDVAKITNISMPSASQHLKILEIRNLLNKERKGRVIYYYLNQNNKIVMALIKAIK